MKINIVMSNDLPKPLPCKMTSALRDMYRSRGTAEEQLQELISEVESAIRWLEEVDVEKVRTNVELIREWGQQWKTLAKRELLQ